MEKCAAAGGAARDWRLLIFMINNPIAVEIAKNDDVSAVRLVAFIVEEAHKLKASDVHFDPQNDSIRVRYRIDGALKNFYNIPSRFLSELVSRIKILSGMRTDEHQTPQDGRFRMIAAGRPLDVRASVSPTYYGENAVLRLLAEQAEAFTLESLGFSAVNAQKLRAAICKPYGMILCTGPTGSGKTTTLYALLKSLNTPEVSIITVEDPVEYAIPGICQIQTNPRAGLTFASGLRGLLRQDPDIIMVGEIRDAETAGIAINAALTGHLLLSTLHTNDAAAALPRLLDMKAEGYLIASTVNVVIAQRLVRKICPYCKIQKTLADADLAGLRAALRKNIDRRDFFCGRGCDQCSGTGYAGRTSINEVLILTPEIREAILRCESPKRLKQIAANQGMLPMAGDGLQKAFAGITSIEEVLRVFYE